MRSRLLLMAIVLSPGVLAAGTVCVEEGEDGTLVAKPCPTSAASPLSTTTPQAHSAAPAPVARPTIKRSQALPDPADFAAVHTYVEGLARDPDEQRAVAGFDALVAAGGEFVPALVKIYLDPKMDPRCRWVSGQALGRVRNPDAARALEKGLTDPMPLARIAAVQSVPFHRPSSPRTRLETALQDPAAVVRAAAADSLASLGDPGAVPALQAAWKDPVNQYKGKSLFVRAHIVTALGELGGPEVVPVLVEALGDVDTRDAARAALPRATGRVAPPPGPGTEAQRWLTWYQSEQR